MPGAKDMVREMMYGQFRTYLGEVRQFSRRLRSPGLRPALQNDPAGAFVFSSLRENSLFSGFHTAPGVRQDPKKK